MYIKFTISHLADFFSKRLTNEDNGSNQTQQNSNDKQVLWQVSVSLMQ